MRFFSRDMNRGNGVNMAPVLWGVGSIYTVLGLEWRSKFDLLVPGKKYDTRKFGGESRDISEIFRLSSTWRLPPPCRVQYFLPRTSSPSSYHIVPTSKPPFTSLVLPSMCACAVRV